MAVRFEWQTYPNGRRRYVRIVDDEPSAPRVASKRTRIIADSKAAPAPKKRGRPPKAKPVETPAPVVIEDASDE